MKSYGIIIMAFKLFYVKNCSLFLRSSCLKAFCSVNFSSLTKFFPLHCSGGTCLKNNFKLPYDQAEKSVVMHLNRLAKTHCHARRNSLPGRRSRYFADPYGADYFGSPSDQIRATIQLKDNEQCRINARSRRQSYTEEHVLEERE